MEKELKFISQNEINQIVSNIFWEFNDVAQYKTLRDGRDIRTVITERIQEEVSKLIDSRKKFVEENFAPKTFSRSLTLVA